MATHSIHLNRFLIMAIVLALLVVMAMSNIASAQNCGPTVGVSCGGSQCCSQFGYCGVTDAYCGSGCQPGYGICG